jgi:hypothetical protein
MSLVHIILFSGFSSNVKIESDVQKCRDINILERCVAQGKLSSVVYWLACLPVDIWFAGSNLAEGDGALRAIRIRSTPSFGEEVKSSVTYRNILRHVKDA